MYKIIKLLLQKIYNQDNVSQAMKNDVKLAIIILDSNQQRLYASQSLSHARRMKNGEAVKLAQKDLDQINKEFGRAVKELTKSVGA